MIGTVVFVVTALSCTFASQLFEQLIQQTDTRAGDLAQQVFIEAKYALVEAAQQGLRPDSDARHAFEVSEGLRTQLIAAKENPLVYEVAIVNTDGVVLASSEENHQGKIMPRRAPLSQLVGRSFIHQTHVLLWSDRRAQLFEHDYAFINDNKPFGEIRIVVDSGLLVQEIKSDLRIWGIIVLTALVISALLAAMVSRIGFLRPARVNLG